MGHGCLQNQTDALKVLHDLYAHNTDTNNTASHKPRTVAERARESFFSRLVEILTQIITIERDLLGCLPEDTETFLRHKDSVDLKNICIRMAQSESGYQSDRNLKELRVCLQFIVTNLLAVVRDQNNVSSAGATRRLTSLSITFPDI